MPPPKLVTSALIIKDDSILLIKNRKNHGQWSFPGGIGAWEKTSDPLEAVILEVQGDIGCHFQGDFFMSNYRSSPEPTLTLFYIGTIQGNPTLVCKNILEARYIPLTQAQTLSLAYEHNSILKKYIQKEK